MLPLKLKITSLFLLLYCFELSINDCPALRSPADTYSSVVTAEIINTLATPIFSNTYSYTFVNSARSGVPGIAIGLIGMQYDTSAMASFKIVNIPSPSISNANFQITVEKSTTTYSLFKFAFLLSTSSLFQIGNIVYPVTANNQVNIPFITGLTLTNPSIQTFLSGVRVSLKGAINASLSLVLSLPLIQGPSLLFNLIYNFNNFLITEITFSYVIFDKNSIQAGNSFRSTTFQLRASLNNQFLIRKWAYDGLLFMGLSQITINFNTLNGLSLQLKNDPLYLYSYFDKSSNGDAFTFRFLQILINEATICNNCNSGNFLYQNSFCIRECPSGTVPITSSQPQSCLECDVTKYMIANSNLNICTCADQNYLDSVTNSCKPCNYTCLICSNPTTCLFCGNVNLTFRSLNNRGQCQCIQGYYNEINNIMCQRCHLDCLTCNGPLDIDCIACQSNSLKNNFNQCVCSQGFVKVNTACICDSNNRVLINGQCIDKLTRSICTDNQILTSSIVTLPLSTPSPTKSPCQCNSGFSLIKGSCSKCVDFSIYNATIGDCQCLPNYYLVNGLCITCQAPKFFNSATSKCTCPYGTNENSQGICIQCNLKQIFLNNQCVCVNGYYMANDGTCLRCFENSPQCIPPSVKI